MTKKYPLSIAPMIDYSDRHFRFFLRQLTQHSLLYSEMISTGAILHGDRARFLQLSQAEHPVALQLGGDTPNDLAACAKYGHEAGYCEINLNLGCPSEKVQRGNFGASLMNDKDKVARSIEAMTKSVAIPITAKYRIGVFASRKDALKIPDYDKLYKFTKTLQEAGCKRFTIHARVAVLEGLSPKENRAIPPLLYQHVFNLQRDFKDLIIEINGGVTSLAQAQEHLQRTSGVMIGRAAFQNPWIFSEADQLFYNENINPTRQEVLNNMLSYIEKEFSQGTPIKSMIRHLIGFIYEQAGARIWRQNISKIIANKNATIKDVENLFEYQI